MSDPDPIRGSTDMTADARAARPDGDMVGSDAAAGTDDIDESVAPGGGSVATAADADAQPLPATVGAVRSDAGVAPAADPGPRAAPAADLEPLRVAEREPEPAAEQPAAEEPGAAEPETVAEPAAEQPETAEPEAARERAAEPETVAGPAAEVVTIPIAPAQRPVLAPAIPPVETAPAGADLVPLTDLAPAITEVSLSRRAFLGFGLTLAGGLAGAGIMTRFVPIFAEPPVEPPPIVKAYDPATKAWTFVVDTASCIGCGLCVVACKEENNVTEDPGFSRTWVERHAVAIDGAVYIDSPDGGAKGFPPTSTAAGAAGVAIDRAFFESRLCMQCEDSPCVGVCPVSATYRTAEGIVLVDARRCIGCGYCVVACPYGARYLTPAGPDNPNATAGVADKCTWCYHRISRGSLPACVEVCPVGSRKFGDANDPDSEVAAIVRARTGKPLHPEYGTRPRVLYLGETTEEA